MAPLKINAFGGIMPLVDKRSLPATAAQVAHNVDLRKGTLRPFHAPLQSAVLPDALRTSLYRYRDTWLSWSADTDVVKSFLSDDDYDRIYYTDGVAPKIRGILGVDQVEYDLGLPRPTSKLTATVATKTTFNHEFRWGYFYEESDGSQKDITENVAMTEEVPGRRYTLTPIPARSEASTAARLVFFVDAYKISNGVLIGRAYAQVSAYAGNSDLYVDGSKVDIFQTWSPSGNWVRLYLGYNVVTGEKTIKVKWKGRSYEFNKPVQDTRFVSLYYTQDKSWVYTFVSAFGEEGPPSEPSDIVAMDPSQQATLTGFDTTVAGTRNVTKIRIYRVVTGDAGADYAYVGEIDFGTTSYVDTVADEDTQETLPSTTWLPPEATMKGLRAMPGGVMVGFFDKTVCFSEPGFPHAWPTQYQTTVSNLIVGIAVSGNTVVVSTVKEPELITAPDPSNVTVTKVPSPQACLSKRGMVEFGGAVFFPSPDGLVSMTGMTATIVTAAYYTKEQWAALNPATMLAAVYDNRLFLFASQETLIFEFFADGLRIVTTDVRASGAYVDVEGDFLYLIQGANITIWDAGTASLSFRWRSREYSLPRPADFGVGGVEAYGYPVTFRLRAEDVQVVEHSIDSGRPRRLAKARPEKYWAIEVEGASEVTELLLTHSMGDL